MRYLILILTAGLVIIVDQLSKFVIYQTLSPGESIPVVKGFFYITSVQNPGAAFGIFPNQYPFLIIITLLTIGIILFYARNMHSLNLPGSVALGLILGGAIGNLIDRLARGQVIDFLDFRVWPVFNIADSAIVVGLIFLGLILAFRH